MFWVPPIIPDQQLLQGLETLSALLYQEGKLRPYTPTWTSSGTAPALGNGTLKGFYGTNGAIMIVTVELVMGSTTTFGTGEYYISLPRQSTNQIKTLGSALYYDNGVLYKVGISAADPGEAKLRFYSDAGATPVGQLVPFAWGNGDKLWATIQYPVP